MEIKTEATQQPVYETNCKWNEGSDHTLVLDCSDPRLAASRVEFLVRHLNLAHYDSIVVPSGPTVVTISEVTFMFDRERVQMLHKLHNFHRVVGIAHHDCGYYKLKYPDSDDASRRERQYADLYRFRTDMQMIIPEVEVDLFYAAPNDQGFVTYTKVV